MTDNLLGDSLEAFNFEPKNETIRQVLGDEISNKYLERKACLTDAVAIIEKAYGKTVEEELDSTWHHSRMLYDIHALGEMCEMSNKDVAVAALQAQEEGKGTCQAWLEILFEKAQNMEHAAQDYQRFVTLFWEYLEHNTTLLNKRDQLVWKSGNAN